MWVLGEYKQGISGSLRELLGNWHPERDVWINYGQSTIEIRPGYLIINRPKAVAQTVDKVTMLSVLGREGINAPGIDRDGVITPTVVKIRGHKGGRGVKIVRTARELDRACRKPNTYVEEYIPCSQEWRVDVIGGKTMARLKVGGRGEIRNKRYGWTFSFPLEPASSNIRQAAIAAVKALGLDFGAVDVGEREGRAVPVVYEVNTAPRLTSPTVTNWYAKTLVGYIERRLR